MKDVILLDGACGTCLFKKAEERGLEKIPVWMYSVKAPDMVQELAEEYVEAGTKIVQTNTFSANPAAVEHEGFEIEKIIAAAVKISKRAVSGTDCRVSLDVGPLTKHLEPYGDMTEEECRGIFSRIFSAGLDEGVDLITLETFMDLNMLKIAAHLAAEMTGSELPVLCSMTYQREGRSLFGNTPKEAAEFAEDFAKKTFGKEAENKFAIGINCSFGPEAAMKVLDEYAEYTKLPLLFKPNVDEGVSARDFADMCRPAFPKVRYIGSCCNSSPEFIKELSRI